MLTFGVTGNRSQNALSVKQAKKLLKSFGGVFTGTLLGKKWSENRFRFPYLRHGLWEAGYAVDTLETATDWSNVDHLLNQVEGDSFTRNALADADVVVVNIGFNDTPWNRGDDPCHVAPNYPVVMWDQITDACIASVADEYAERLDAVLTTVDGIVPGDSALRVVGVYNSTIGDYVDESWDSPEAVAPSIAAWPRITCTSRRMPKLASSAVAPRNGFRSFVPSMIITASSGLWLASSVGRMRAPLRSALPNQSSCAVVRPPSPSAITRAAPPSPASSTLGQRSSNAWRGPPITGLEP